MMRRRRTKPASQNCAPEPDDARRSEAGDTLIEVLLAITVIGIGALALLLGFATAISGSAEHRNLATFDTVLRTASAQATSGIEQLATTTDFANCSSAYAFENPSSGSAFSLPAGYSASITSVAYWTTSNSWSTPAAPSSTCPSNVGSDPAQLLTIKVSYKGTSSTITTVVDDPNAPSGTPPCSGQPATQLVWLSEPGPNQNAGQVLFPDPSVELQAANGCQETLDASAVTLSVYSGPTGSALSSCESSPGNGVTTWNDCVLNTPGTYTLQASDSTDNVTSAPSTSFTVVAGTAVKLVIQQSPCQGTTAPPPYATTCTGGTAWPSQYQPIVHVEDALGDTVASDNTTVTLSIASGTGTSGATLSNCTATAVAGVAQFQNCSINTIGTGYELTATDAGDNLTAPSAASLPFNIYVGPPTQLQFTTQPSASNVTGGKFATQPVVTIEDAGGNVQTADTSTVTLSLAGGTSGATVSGCTETTTAGVATFSGCSVNEAGTGYTLTATVTNDKINGASFSGTSNPFNVAAAQLTSFTVAPANGNYNETAGTSFNVTITALDQIGDTYTPLSGPENVTYGGPANSPLPSNTAPAYPASVTFAGGVATAAVTLYDAQTTPLTASLTTAQGTATGTSGNFTVNPSTAKTLSVSGFPLSTTAGASGSVTVTADDTYDNVATGYRGTIKFTSSDTDATLPSNYAFTGTNPLGTHTFTNVALNTVGTQSITATDTTTSTITGTEGSITVTKTTPSLSTTLSAGSITVGTSAHDTATLSGAANSTGSGTVTYTYYTNNTCTSGAVSVNTVTVPTNGTVPNSSSVTFNSAGTYYWQASYSGDANNNAATSLCNEQLTVNKATPTISTTLSAGSITVGTSANDTSALTGLVNSTGSGTVTYTYYTNNTCTSGAVSVNTVTVPTNGTVPNSSSVTFNTTGTYYWQASYSGDANNNAATSLCNEPLIVKYSPSITTALSAGSITAGTAANDTATLSGSGASTGSATVTYRYYTNNTCTANAVTVNTVTVPTNGTVPNSSSVTFGSAGTYYWQASYSGDADNFTTTSPCTAGSNEQLTVTKASPSITTTLSAASITAGTTAHDASALIAAGTSTGSGTVTYSYYTNNTCTANTVTVNTVTVSTGGAVPNSSSVTFNSAGTFYWQASYSGDANNNAATSPCTAVSNEQLTVTKASPSLSTTLSAGSIAAGTAANDTATLSGSVNSTGSGTVTYSYYTNNTCTANTVTVNTVTVSTGGSVPNSSSVTFNSAGTFYWQASYSGDANNFATTSSCTAGNNEQLTVTKASPSISTTLSAGTVTVGAAANDTATLTGVVNSTGSGTVTYSYYTNNTCTANTVTVNTVTVSTGGSVPNSSSVTFNSAGTFYWQASYSGDANNFATTSPCTAGNDEQLTVAKASPSLTTALSAGSITAGTAANDTATLTGAVNSTGSGTVVYRYYTNNTCSTGTVTVNTVTVSTGGSVPNSSSVTFNSAGTFYWQASYSGDANNTATTSSCTAGNNEQLTVTKASPSISTTLSAASIAAGTAANDTATLSGSVNSTGSATVTYSYYTNNTCSTGTVAVNTVTVSTGGSVPNSSSVTFGSAGTFYWQASYSGDANNFATTSPCTAGTNEQLMVTKASPSLSTTLSAASITAGSAANDTAALSGAGTSTGSATVTYSYYTNNTCSTGTVAVNTVTVSTGGSVPNSSSVTFGSAGTYYWQASYSGDANNFATTSPCTAGNNEQLTVTKASPSLSTTLSAASIAAGTAADDTATLSGAGTSTGSGTVTYSYYTNNTCTANTVTVNTVTVSTGGTVPNSSSVTFGSAGTFYWQASYSGDANNFAATSSCTAGNNEQLTVTKASPSISTALSASSITAGSTANDTATLTGAGTSTGSGTVTYRYYTNNTCSTGTVTVNTVTVSTGGSVPNSSSVTFNSAGTFYWQASYSGDANNFATTSPCTAGTNEQLTVNKASPSITTTLSAGSITAGTTANDTATLTGVVNSTGSGTVTYSYYTNNTCSTGTVAVNTVTVSTGGAVPNSSSVTFGSAGTFYWQASYSGDANNNAATSPCTAGNNEQLTVNKASPSLTTTLSAASITAGSTANDTATLSGAGTSTGSATVTYSYYTNNTCSTGTVAVNTVTVSTGGAVPNSSSVTFGSAGTFYWQASYSGDANNFAATSPCTAGNNEQLTVTKASPSITTALSAGSITAGATANDTATLSGAATSTGSGTVTYSYYTNNTCSTGTVTVNTVTVSTGGAVPNSSSVTFGSAGTFYWQASYSGDANNFATTSPCTAGTNEQLTVAKASPSITTALSAGSITAGTAANDTATLNGAVNSTGSGTVTYHYYTNNTCSTGTVAVNTVTVSTGGLVPNSSSVTFNSAGTFYWQASYSGDANNFATTSSCTAGNNEQLTVTKASPSLSTTLSAASIAAGTAANDTATLSGAVNSTGSGTVSYTYYTNNTCSTGAVAVNTVTVSTGGTVPNSSSVTFGGVGTFYWQASYSGDANNFATTSPCTAGTNEQLTVTKASPSISTTLSAASIAAGTAADDTATLSGAGTSTGSGTVTYSYYTNNTCSTGTVAVNTVTVSTGGAVPNSSSVTFGSAGTFYWQASYSGDANNFAATSPCTAGNNEQLTVTKASPSITTALSAGSITAGATANDTATLSGAATSTGSGMVTYSYYTNNTCSTGTVTVNTVTVSTGGAVPNSSSVTFGSAGTFYWQASYSGDANNNAVKSTCTAGTNEQLTVNKASPSISTALSPSTITAGGSTHDTATLNGAATSTGSGTVTYHYYTNSGCTQGNHTVNTVTVSTGGAVPNSSSVTFGSSGTYYWQAVYSGDSNNNAATSTCTSEQLTVNP